MRQIRLVVRFLIGLVCLAALLSGMFVGFTGFGGVVGAAAQTGEASSPLSALEPFLEKARESGATVIVVDPTRKATSGKTAEQTNADYYDQSVEVSDRLEKLLADAGVFISNVGSALAAVGPGGSTRWIWHGILIALLGSAVGAFVARWVQGFGRSKFAHIYNEQPENRTEKLSYLLFRAVMMSLGVVLFLVIAAIIVLALDLGSRPSRITASAIVFGIAYVWAVRIVMMNLLAPDSPGHRTIFMSDSDAQALYNSFMSAFIIAAILTGASNWIEQLGLDTNTYKLMLIGSYFIVALLLCGLVVGYRKAVAKAILGDHVLQQIPLWRRIIAATWHLLAILYFLFAWAVSTVRLIMDLPASTGLVGGPILALIVAYFTYSLALVIIDQFFKRRIRLRDSLVEQKVEQARAISADRSPQVGSGDETQLDEEDDENAIPGEVPEAPLSFTEKQVFRDLIEHGAAILVVFGAIILLLDTWGLDITAQDHPITNFFDVLVVVFIAYMSYQAVKVWIDSKIEDEEPHGPGDGHESTGDAEMGQGATRLATLLPIFRNFLLITIVVISGMIVLSEMGVNIAPLFAGAGVVGLAVGFGAQALIRDIFSGAFFLMDDAFRRGEYVNLGSIQGVVEKISIRSFQLRHHNGPLHTIPFGEIKQLTNFSRDWVMMKLKLRVTYDTDVERVRKLVKKLGQELQKDPEYGHMFLEPLKSQGVVEMDDSAMIMRVKFMTKPGDQFVLRRLVYNGIQDLFAREGITFAHREVTVRIADHDEPLTEEEEKAVAGAIRPLLDPPEGQAPGAKGDR